MYYILLKRVYILIGNTKLNNYIHSSTDRYKIEDVTIANYSCYHHVAGTFTLSAMNKIQIK